MSDAPKQCAHKSCTCTVASDKKYCCQNCEDNSGRTDISCDCKHSTCAGAIA